MIRVSVQRLLANAEVRRLVSESTPLYVAGAVSIVLTLAQQLLTARFLGAADFGRLATAVGFVTLALLLVDVRSWELATRVLAIPLSARDHREVSRLVTWLMAGEVVVGLIGMSVVVGLTSLVGGFVDSDLIELIRVLAFLLPLRQLAMGASSALLRMIGAFRVLAARSVATAVARLVLIGGAAAMGLGLRSVAVGVVLAELFGAVSATALAAWGYRVRTGRHLMDRHQPAGFRAAWRLAPKLWVSATIKGVQLETFIPVAAAFASPAEMGVLRTGMDLAQFVNLGTAPVAMVTSPRITTLAQTDRREQLRSHLELASHALAVAAGAFAGLGLCTALVLLPTALGPDFGSVRVVAAALILGSAYQAAKQWVRPLLVGLDRVDSQNRLGMITGLASLVTLPLLTTLLGALGAAINMSLFLISYSTLSSRIARKAFVHGP